MALVVKALKIEIFVLCMIVLIGLAVRSRRSLFSSTQQLLFSMLGYTSAAYILFDMIWTLSDGVDGTLGIAANWISNAVSFSLFAIACLIWFIYGSVRPGLTFRPVIFLRLHNGRPLSNLNPARGDAPETGRVARLALPFHADLPAISPSSRRAPAP